MRITKHKASTHRKWTTMQLSESCDTIIKEGACLCHQGPKIIVQVRMGKNNRRDGEGKWRKESVKKCTKFLQNGRSY